MAPKSSDMTYGPNDLVLDVVWYALSEKSSGTPKSGIFGNTDFLHCKMQGIKNQGSSVGRTNLLGAF